MQEQNNIEQEKLQHKEEPNIFQKIITALVGGILVILQIVFLMPLKLWLASVERLASEKLIVDFQTLTASQLPLLKMVVKIYDIIIIFSYPVLIVVALYDLYKYGIATFVAVLFAGYFVPFYLQLIKELIAIPVSLVSNSEKIAKELKNS